MSKRGVRLKTLADVRRFSARVVNEIYKGEIEVVAGRALLYGCSIISNIIKDDDLEARITALEQQQEGKCL